MDPTQRSQTSGPRMRAPALIAAAVGAALLGAAVSPASADSSSPPVTVGVGIQTSAYSCSNACVGYDTPAMSSGETSSSGFSLDSVRLYINGSVTDTIKMTFNTEYSSATDGVKVMDAIGRFEFSNYVNIWAGRFLPPSDRANLYGPYYANDISPYSDGVADFYPNVAVGRDNGVAYWGDFGPLKVQVGAFDGQSLGGSTAVPHPDKILVAGRVTMDFWDKEAGYYFNGTYYGDKDLLAVGAAAQTLDGSTDFSIDGLMEKNLHGIGVFGVESEYQHDNGLNTVAHNSGWYLLGDYILPQPIGWGKVQLLDKYSHKSVNATPTSLAYGLKTNEFNLNYVIKEFAARVGLYYLWQENNVPDQVDRSHRELGVKLQLQM
ncbi:MAG TPA: hypothetical protein VHZ99_11670 [Steroidobacteraceae bacterium]|nr:hypothetical protein [Steroidobacteraceae bacterium]